MEWVWRFAARSNEQAVANARAATTLLSRRRVERDEVDLFLHQRYAATPTPVPPTGQTAGDARASRIAR